MRIDKFLKIKRLVKRRTVAAVLVKEGSIKVNGKIVKPMYEVKLNDVINLKLGLKEISYTVNEDDNIYLKK